MDGLILADGTEVHLPPHLGMQLVYAVKPGDTVTVLGLKARAIPTVQAISVKNNATGNSVTDNGAGGPPGPHDARRTLNATGRIKAQLHGPRGDLNGALLEGGTIIRLPPPEAQRLASVLSAGAPLTVQGDGFEGALGRVIEARSIGPDALHLNEVAAPPPQPGRRPPPPGGPHGAAARSRRTAPAARRIGRRFSGRSVTIEQGQHGGEPQAAHPLRGS